MTTKLLGLLIAAVSVITGCSTDSEPAAETVTSTTASEPTEEPEVLAVDEEPVDVVDWCDQWYTEVVENENAGYFYALIDSGRFVDDELIASRSEQMYPYGSDDADEISDAIRTIGLACAAHLVLND